MSALTSINQGTTRIRNHCWFAWTEPFGTGGGQRTFVIERGHCARCVAELRQGFPDAAFVGMVPSVAEGTAPPLSPVAEAAGQEESGLVLVVEDDQDERTALRETLAEAGYRAMEAVHGQDALRILETGARPDLMLVDLAMPEMGGWEFLARVRAHARFARIPAVIVTALQGEENEPAYTPRLRKPLEPNALLRLVEHFVRRSSRARGR